MQGLVDTYKAVLNEFINSSSFGFDDAKKILSSIPLIPTIFDKEWFDTHVLKQFATEFYSSIKSNDLNNINKYVDKLNRMKPAGITEIYEFDNICDVLAMMWYSLNTLSQYTQAVRDFVRDKCDALFDELISKKFKVDNSISNFDMNIAYFEESKELYDKLITKEYLDNYSCLKCKLNTNYFIHTTQYTSKCGDCICSDVSSFCIDEYFKMYYTIYTIMNIFLPYNIKVYRRLKRYLRHFEDNSIALSEWSIKRMKSIFICELRIYNLMMQYYVSTEYEEIYLAIIEFNKILIKDSDMIHDPIYIRDMIPVNLEMYNKHFREVCKPHLLKYKAIVEDRRANEVIEDIHLEEEEEYNPLEDPLATKDDIIEYLKNQLVSVKNQLASANEKIDKLQTTLDSVVDEMSYNRRVLSALYKLANSE